MRACVGEVQYNGWVGVRWGQEVAPSPISLSLSLFLSRSLPPFLPLSISLSPAKRGRPDVSVCMCERRVVSYVAEQGVHVACAHIGRGFISMSQGDKTH